MYGHKDNFLDLVNPYAKKEKARRATYDPLTKEISEEGS